MSEKITLPVSIVLAGLFIAGGIYLNGRIAKDSPTPVQKQQLASQNLSDTVRPIDANDHILGSSKARVLVVEYSATECAASLGGNSKFWEYVNKIYEVTPSNNGLDPKELTNIATEIGLSSKDFNVCLDSEEFAQRVNLNMKL